MGTVQVSQGDQITIGDRQVVLDVSEVAPVGAGGDGLPLVRSVAFPMLNIKEAWYEYAYFKGSYVGHPPARDWNLESLGNTDLGEPLGAPFVGIVTAAGQMGGSVGRAVQIMGITTNGRIVVWVGWHLHEVDVMVNDIVALGEQIGSIGNADGRYAGAHLHEQICFLKGSGLPSPTTFATDWRYDWIDCLEFYRQMGIPEAEIERVAGFNQE